jgi:hypothetical protein
LAHIARFGNCFGAPEIQEWEIKMRFAAVICSTLTGLMILSSQAVAQQKTIKACQEEWRTNKVTFP